MAAELKGVILTSEYFDVSSTATNRYSPNGTELATVIHMDCVPHLFRGIGHSEGLCGRCWAHDLATKALAHISLSLDIHTRFFVEDAV